MIKNDRLIKRSMAQMAILVSIFLALGLSEIRGAEKKAGANRESLALTRVANSGVMLASGKIKILIDALFDKPPSDYRSPEPEVIDKIMKGAAPFDDVDLALTTHNHPDHFDAPLAVRFLKASPGTTLAAPEDAVAEMRKQAEWAKIAARVVSLDLKIGEQEQREIAGIPLAACRTLHSGKRVEPMNLMYRLRLNGWGIFHEGDADATLDEYRGFGLEEAEIDLALVHFWFPLHPDMAKLLQEIIRPEHIGLTHLPIRLENDAPGKIDMVRKNYQDIFLLLPGMPVKVFTDAAEQLRPLHALVLLGEWFGDAYFPLQKEMEARGWTQKRVGVDAEYRGCYKKERDVVLTSDILIPDLKDLSSYDVLIIPSGPQFRKFKENPAVLEFLKKIHAGGMLIASFCVGNFLVQAAGLLPEGEALFPEKVTKVKEGLLLGPRGGGPPPGDGFESAPIKEICDAVERELKGRKGAGASPLLQGPYLGQKPPGIIPEIFAPGIISTDKTEYTPAFTPEQDECLYTVFLPSQRHVIMRCRKIDGIWQAPEPAPFCGSTNDADLTLSPDGSKALFWSDRPLAAGEAKDDADLWISIKKNGEWKPAQWLAGAINNQDWQIAPTETAAGTLYFASYRYYCKDYIENLGQMDLYRSIPVNGAYGAPENLGKPVNTAHHEKEPFVAPDEGYLIFTSDRPGGFGDCDLYISFKKENGSWSQPLNMGEAINSAKWEGVPIVSPDGKYLFFSSDRSGDSDVYWLDASIIKKLMKEFR